MTPTTILFDADGVLQRQGPTWDDDLAGLIGTDDPAAIRRFLDDVSAVEVRTLTGELDFAEALPPVVARWRVADSIFDHAVNQLGVDPGEVLFMDDQLRKVEGARTAGLTAELFAQDGGVVELRRILQSHGLPEPAI